MEQDDELRHDGDEVAGDDGKALRRDNLFYLLSEIEGVLDQGLPELSRGDRAAVGARLDYLRAKVSRYCACG